MGRTTNKQRREAVASTAREAAAAARLQQQRAERRRRATLFSSVTAGILVVVVIIVLVAVNHKGSSGPTKVADQGLVSQVTNVQQASLDSIGADTSGSDADSSAGLPRSISDSPLTTDGKPQVLYVGAEFCPFCAVERWSMVNALSRFGSFSGLQQLTSSEDSIPTFSFAKSAYTSSTVAFTPYEDEGQNHEQLDSPPANLKLIWFKYTNNQGGYPFIDIAGKYVVIGTGVDPTKMQGMTADQVAAAVKNQTGIGKQILGVANQLTAAICSAIGSSAPTSVCTPAITALSSSFPAYASGSGTNSTTSTAP